MTARETQLDRLREAARQLECDDDKAAFDAKLKKVAKAPKPKDNAPADPQRPTHSGADINRF